MEKQEQAKKQETHQSVHRKSRHRRFCPKCGAANADGELCSDCRVTGLPQKLLDDTVEVKYCTSCKKYWSSRVQVMVRNIQDVLQRQLKPFFSKGSSFKLDIPVFQPHVQHQGPGVTEEMEIVLDQENQTYHVPVLVSFTTCNHCGKRGTDYFEGVLQLRNTTPELLIKIRKEINRRSSRGFITKEVPIHEGIGGVDVYITSQSYLQALGQKLQKRFGGELKLSSRIFGHDRLRSRDVYRRTILLVLPPFGVNDVISTEGRIVKVTRLGKMIRGFDLRQKKTVILTGKEQPVVLKKQKVMIAQIQPDIRVIHSETFQPVLLYGVPQQSDHQLQPGQKVVAVFFNHAYWFVK